MNKESCKRDRCAFCFTAYILQSRRATVALKGKLRILTPALAAAPPAEVSLLIKLPVIDASVPPRCNSISSSKVQPLLSTLHEVPPDIVSSLWSLLGVGTILRLPS